jgi:lipopolysaccharide/colanic/teichoic acid biosynthesis glycosyltransferase
MSSSHYAIGVARRCLNGILASIGLVILSPVLAVIAVGIKIDSPGSVFYRGVRVGRKGRTFRIFKFRTMYALGSGGSPITVKGDPRITPFGRLLRGLKLDELPQLINVVRGEMSFVGPRPEDPKYLAAYSSQQSRLLDALPGMTSPGSLLYRDEASMLQGDDWEQTYCHRILPRKLEVDLAYMDRANLWSDLGVIGQTIRLLLFRHNHPQKIE